MRVVTDRAGRPQRPNPLLAFYAGTGPDQQGRHIDEVWALSRRQLEWDHAYIQWLFPARKRSAFNDLAPVLADATVDAFHGSAHLRARLLRSLDLMLGFYGLVRMDDGTGVPRIEPGPDLAAIGPAWWGAGNHNHLRLTRIMDSLASLGLEREAAALHEALLGLHATGRTGITVKTLRYWAAAARPQRD